MPPSNQAAWIMVKRQPPLTIAKAPYTRPEQGQVVIRVIYCAVNPADIGIATTGARVSVYPNILGQNVSGYIEEVHKGISSLTKGDRVMAHVMSVVTQAPAEGGFQTYCIARVEAVCRIPDFLAFDKAAVLPLAISTATVGLYMSNQLRLDLPQVTPPPRSARTLLVWGGSSSVGVVVIQLARASGYRIITTCSPRNEAYVRELGAETVFDYSSPSIVHEICSAVQNDSLDLVGAYNCIASKQAAKACSDVVAACRSCSSNTRRVASVPPAPDEFTAGVEVVLLGPAATMFFDERKDVAQYIWQGYLPKALSHGSFRAEPPPLLAGKGMDSIQKALDILAGGVSAKKVVVQVQE